MPTDVLGIDVGGSSVKAGRLDTRGGALQGGMLSVPTPRPTTPAALLPVLAQLARSLPDVAPRVGVTLPSVIKDGRVYTAANIDPSWIGVDAVALTSQALGRKVVVLNDADAAGLAEVRWGAGRGLRGTVIMLTFGTGIGSAVFHDGHLLPNTEFGHMELRGADAEKWASARVRTAQNLDFPAWAARVNDYLHAMQQLFWPDVFILGGAVSERFAEFAPLLSSPVQLKAAHFTGQAGVIGAALAAAEAGD
ncbi:MAG: ROK family protein [Proteobacteria bacterium]|nr:ROK family protein [Pseudomonadota bacterium]